MRALPVGVLAAFASITVGCHRAPTPAPVVDAAAPIVDADVPEAAPAVDAAPPRVLPDVETEWCLPPWRGLDAATCYFIPDNDGGLRPTELLIYLAGIVPPGGTSTPKVHVQTVVANSATKAGVIALLPRGRIGIGPKDAEKWWAWPTGGLDYTKYATELVDEWKSERKALEDALGYSFEKVYLAGSSSGAYFLSLLAIGGAVDFDGYCAASGGAIGPGIGKTAVPKPFYVGWGEGDPTKDHPRLLAEFLKSKNWPLKTGVHQTGHGAREIYLEEAFAFWRSKT